MKFFLSSASGRRNNKTRLSCQPQAASQSGACVCQLLGFPRRLPGQQRLATRAANHVIGAEVNHLNR